MLTTPKVKGGQHGGDNHGDYQRSRHNLPLADRLNRRRPRSGLSAKRQRKEDRCGEKPPRRAGVDRRRTGRVQQKTGEGRFGRRSPRKTCPTRCGTAKLDAESPQIHPISSAINSNMWWIPKNWLVLAAKRPVEYSRCVAFGTSLPGIPNACEQIVMVCVSTIKNSARTQSYQSLSKLQLPAVPLRRCFAGSQPSGVGIIAITHTTAICCDVSHCVQCVWPDYDGDSPKREAACVFFSPTTTASTPRVSRQCNASYVGWASCRRSPATEQSGVGHSITYLTPLIVREVFHHQRFPGGRGQRWGWAVQGKPG